MVRRLVRGIVRHLTGYDVVRIVLGFLLLVAAGLKAYQLATDPVLSTGLLDSRWLLTAVVEFELLFGLWLLGNVWPKPTWAAALVCFSLFTCVSLSKDLSGHSIGHQVALIEMPPYSFAETTIASERSTYLPGRVSDSREWFVETPVEITLDQGFVVTFGGKVLDSPVTTDGR